MPAIFEHCNYCQKRTETLEIAGGDCKECVFSKVTPKTLCSFCAKDKTEVKNLITGGPNYSELKGDEGKPVYICNECIEMCQEVIDHKALDEVWYRKEALNKWLVNNGNGSNEKAFREGWDYNGEEDPDFTLYYDWPYDFEAGVKAKRKYLEGK